MRRRMKGFLGVAALGLAALCVWQVHASASEVSGFPDGYDAVQAAPDSHKIIFENALVRVLEVTVPPSGQTEPMHHHRWPSFFLNWDTGGRSPHIRYHQPGGVVRDSPGSEQPMHAGRWSVHWMKPESMHAIESVESDPPRAGEPPLLRVEIKVGT
jgi:hypothetical protein